VASEDQLALYQAQVAYVSAQWDMVQALQQPWQQYQDLQAEAAVGAVAVGAGVSALGVSTDLVTDAVLARGLGGAISGGVSAGVQGKSPQAILQAAAVNGAVSVVNPGAGIASTLGVGALAGNVANTMVSNATNQGLTLLETGQGLESFSMASFAASSVTRFAYGLGSAGPGTAALGLGQSLLNSGVYGFASGVAGTGMSVMIAPVVLTP
jgi:hypothetical protein